MTALKTRCLVVRELNKQFIRICSDCSNKGKELNLVVSSLRVDNVAATGFSLSRRNTDLFFLSKLLYLNGNIVDKKSTQIKPGDVIDRIRREESNNEVIKFDSLKILEVGMKTAKGKHRIFISRKKAVSLPWNEFAKRTTQRGV